MPLSRVAYIAEITQVFTHASPFSNLIETHSAQQSHIVYIICTEKTEGKYMPAAWHRQIAQSTQETDFCAVDGSAVLEHC